MMEQISQLIALDDEIRALKARLELLTDQRQALEQRVLDAMSQQGVDSVRINGRTVYIRRQLWASIPQAEIEAAMPALQAAGISDLVRPTVNTQTLSAWVRELASTADGMPEVPEPLKPYVRIAEKFSVQVR